MGVVGYTSRFPPLLFGCVRKGMFTTLSNDLLLGEIEEIKFFGGVGC